MFLFAEEGVGSDGVLAASSGVGTGVESSQPAAANVAAKSIVNKIR